MNNPKEIIEEFEKEFMGITNTLLSNVNQYTLFDFHKNFIIETVISQLENSAKRIEKIQDEYTDFKSKATIADILWEQYRDIKSWQELLDNE